MRKIRRIFTFLPGTFWREGRSGEPRQKKTSGTFHESSWLFKKGDPGLSWYDGMKYNKPHNWVIEPNSLYIYAFRSPGGLFKCVILKKGRVATSDLNGGRVEIPPKNAIALNHEA